MLLGKCPIRRQEYKYDFLNILLVFFWERYFIGLEVEVLYSTCWEKLMKKIK